MLKISLALGVITAFIMVLTKLALAEVLWWPFVVPEYAVAAMLLAGTVWVLIRQNPAVLSAGWGASAMLSGSTLSHHLEPAHGFATAGPVEYALALQFGVSVTGLVLLICGTPPPRDRA